MSRSAAPRRAAVSIAFRGSPLKLGPPRRSVRSIRQPCPRMSFAYRQGAAGPARMRFFAGHLFQRAPSACKCRNGGRSRRTQRRAETRRLGALPGEPRSEKRNVRKGALIPVTTCVVLVFGFTLARDDSAAAATKAQRCQAYAHNMARSAPTRGGPVRGAVAGAAIGSFSASAGAGAAIGAGVGATRRVVQRSRSYRYYYDRCMGR
jgi:hypothetical protein